MFLFSRTSVIVVEHSSWHLQPWAIRLLRRLIYPLADVVVVLNPTDFKHYSGFHANVRLIPNPITTEKPGTPVKPREKVVLAVGHLEPVKNHQDVVQAMWRSGLDKQGWSLVIIGTGSQKARLSELICQLSLKNAKIIQPTDRLDLWYAKASLLGLSSVTEGFSLVLAEAMLAGVVPVAYASDGPSFILSEFQNNLVKIGDVAALSDRLAGFAQSSDLEEIRCKLAHSVSLRFSSPVVLEYWKKLFQELGVIG